MNIPSLPSRTSPYISFSELGRNLKKALCEEDKPIIFCDSSEYMEIDTKVVSCKQQIEYFTESLPTYLNEQEALADVDTEKGQETEDGEQETIYRAIPLVVISDEQGAQQQYCSSTETLLASYPKARQVFATFDMEKGKKGERFELNRKDSAISLSFLSGNQLVAGHKSSGRFDIPLLPKPRVRRSCCPSTETYTPITNWRQNFDPQGTILNAERQKAEQALANSEKMFQLLASLA